MTYLSLRAIVCALIVFLAPPSLAAEWHPISLTVSQPGSDTPYDSFVYPASNFFDGAYMSSWSFVLSDSSNISAPTYIGETRTVIAFASSVGTPPLVDLDQHTINVGSIFAAAEQGDVDCNVSYLTCDPRHPKLVWAGQIGWTFGPQDSVGYVVNDDGSFTATWNATDSLWFFNGFGSNDTVRFTFAAAVPEPSVALSLVVGLILIAGRARYQGRQTAA